MADLAPRERLQPSLLDRLTDEEPGIDAEPRERRVLSLRALRNSVLRDLAWLFNTTCLLSAADAPRLPQVANSVLNYGMPDLSGNAISSLNLARLERAIRQAIWDFEPRLIRSTVAVRAMTGEAAAHNKISFEIEADMWAQPYPERLYLRTELDLEDGCLTLADSGARSAA
jgi:type VI secretion system protein ImpF